MNSSSLLNSSARSAAISDLTDPCDQTDPKTPSAEIMDTNKPVPKAAKIRPWVLVPACLRDQDGHPFHCAGNKYLEFVHLAGGYPLIMPAGHRENEALEQLLDLCDGVLLPGSPSNVHPSHFAQTVHNPALPLDPVRDALTLSLIPKVLGRGIPLFAICRGFQEMNVALGGSLHQAVHELAQFQDHREQGKTLEQQYRPAHPVLIEPGGLLAELVGTAPLMVNSLHGQGVDRLAPGLRIEAQCSDGLIEAFTWTLGPGFNVGVQWHPEWHASQNPISQRLAQAFGQACLAYNWQKLQMHKATVRNVPEH